MRKHFRRIAVAVLICSLIGCAAAAGINGYVKHVGGALIAAACTAEHPRFTEKDAEVLKEKGADCILVLGCGIRDDETPTPMLRDRLDAGIALYRAGAAPKILLSGDNGTEGHNEIHVMLNYTLDAGVPKEDIFCDHAGFSTYDSMYRAKEVFDAERLVVVTQTYHEYRALYIGDRLGLSVAGAAADQAQYAGQSARDLREVLARVKDFFKVMGKPESVLGGDSIPISGSGLVSHGE